LSKNLLDFLYENEKNNFIFEAMKLIDFIENNIEKVSAFEIII